jgi:hypothetical protein
MDASRALDQIAEIHRQMAKGEVYRGYRSLPVAMSGLVGVAAAAVQPASLTRDPNGYLLYWSVAAAAAALVGSSEILYNYLVTEDASGRRQTRRVAGQFLPALFGGAAVAACFAHASAGLIALLPGLWAICFGIGIFACRPYLPRASGWIALFYYASGFMFLWVGHGIDPLNGWWLGGIFGVGQLLAAAVLWWNLERS